MKTILKYPTSLLSDESITTQQTEKHHNWYDLHPSEQTITVGDLHGNALKMLYIMIKAGMATTTEENYTAFAINYHYKKLAGLLINLDEPFYHFPKKIAVAKEVADDKKLRVKEIASTITTLIEIDPDHFYTQFPEIADLISPNIEPDAIYEAIYSHLKKDLLDKQIQQSEYLNRLTSQAILAAPKTSAIQEIIAQINFKPDAPLLRLLGDIFSDRGADDIITATLITQALSAGCRMTFIGSNHCLGLMNIFTGYHPDVLPHDSALDILRIRRDSHENFLSLKEEFVKTIYPFYKLIDFELSSDLQHIALFMHAPNSIESIYQLIGEFSVDVSDITIPCTNAIEFANLIDRINLKYSAYIQDCLLNNNPIEKGIDFVWSRMKNVRCIKEDAASSCSSLSQQLAPEFIDTIVHGHIGAEQYLPSIRFVNLDNDTGKSMRSSSYEDTIKFRKGIANSLRVQLELQDNAPKALGSYMSNENANENTSVVVNVGETSLDGDKDTDTNSEYKNSSTVSTFLEKPKNLFSAFKKFLRIDLEICNQVKKQDASKLTKNY